MQRVPHTHTRGQIRCRSYNSGQHWAGGGQRAGWFLRVTRAWGVTSQRLVWCGDGPARPPQPGLSRYVLHQLRSPRRNGAKRPAHLITPSRAHVAHTSHNTVRAREPQPARRTCRPNPVWHRVHQLGPNHCTIMAQRLPDKAPQDPAPQGSLPHRTHAATFSTSHPYPGPFSPWLGFSLAIYPWLG